MALLTRDEILACRTFGGESLNIPELGGEIRIGRMNGTARDKWEKFVRALDKRSETEDNYRAMIVASCVIDEEGNPLFSALDLEAIGRLPHNVLDQIIEAYQRLNGLQDQDVKEALKN